MKLGEVLDGRCLTIPPLLTKEGSFFIARLSYIRFDNNNKQFDL